MIEYNQRWFTKDKEGRGEKELLEEISKNNEKSRPSRAKPDGEGDPEMAKILLSLTKVKGKEATATVMAKLPPSVRGHNRDDFDDKKNEAEEEADGKKNNGDDDNDDGGGTGDDGNDNEWGNGDAYDRGDVLDDDNDEEIDGIADHDNIAGKSAEDLTFDQPLPEGVNIGVSPGEQLPDALIHSMSPSVPAKKRAAASPLFEDSDTSEDKNNYNDAAPTISSQATKLLRTGNAEASGREMVSNLMRPLTPEERTVVANATEGIGPPTEILAKQGADSVQRGSMQTLRPGQWLNNEVINYFLKNCLARRDEKMCARDTGRRRSHFFNSIFVQTMFDEKNDDPKLRGRYNYGNVKSWSKKVPGEDIFNLKYILCPINLNNKHWMSAVIFMEDKRIQYYNLM